jgi:hypothetical protein
VGLLSMERLQGMLGSLAEHGAAVMAQAKPLWDL